MYFSAPLSDLFFIFFPFRPRRRDGGGGGCISVRLFLIYFLFFSLLDPEDAMAAEEDVFQCAYFCPLVHLVTQDLDPTGIFWVEFCAWVKLFLGKILYLVHLVTKDLDPTGIFWGGC